MNPRAFLAGAGEQMVDGVQPPLDAAEVRARFSAMSLHLGGHLVLGVLELLPPHAEAVDGYRERTEHVGHAEPTRGGFDCPDRRVLGLGRKRARPPRAVGCPGPNYVANARSPCDRTL
jgi:hypothetical protein